jgi:hypothetical protein
MRRWAYAEPGWARIASLAPLVLQCAEEGDSVAFRIITAAADEAVSAVVAAVSRARLKGRRFTLVLSGAHVHMRTCQVASAGMNRQRAAGCELWGASLKAWLADGGDSLHAGKREALRSSIFVIVSSTCPVDECRSPAGMPCSLLVLRHALPRHHAGASLQQP